MELIITGGVTGKFSSLREYLGKEREIVSGTIDRLTLNSQGEVKLENILNIKLGDHIPNFGLRDNRLTSASMHGGKLYVGFPTQVLIIDPAGWNVIKTIDHKLFNDIHHVKVVKNILYVVSTGIDAVVSFDLKGEFLKIYPIGENRLWEDYSPDTDFRSIDTKPHKHHPNYIVSFNDEIWVTRFKQRDIVKLHNRHEAIVISKTTGIHDGVTHGDKCYFTAVDGRIIILNINEKKIDQIVDLNNYYDSKKPLGWCRGFCKIGDCYFLGFSALRPTKIEQNLQWVKNRFSGGFDFKDRLPSRIVVFDYKKNKIVREISIPPKCGDMLFTIMPEER